MRRDGTWPQEPPQGHETVSEAPVRLMVRTSFPASLFVAVDGGTATLDDGTVVGIEGGIGCGSFKVRYEVTLPDGSSGSVVVDLTDLLYPAIEAVRKQLEADAA